MRHYPDLASGSDWLKQISHPARPIRTTTQIFPRSFLVIIFNTNVFIVIIQKYWRIIFKSSPSSKAIPGYPKPVMYYTCVFVPLVFILLNLVRYHLQAVSCSKSWVRLLRLRNCRPREPVELAEPTEPREMTVFTDNYLSNFSLADWSRPIVDNSTDHGNEVMVAQLVFSFPQAIFHEKSTARWATKTVNVIVKTNGHQLSMVCTLLDHRNEVKMSKLYNETTLLRLVVPL